MREAARRFILPFLLVVPRDKEEKNGERKKEICLGCEEMGEPATQGKMGAFIPILDSGVHLSKSHWVAQDIFGNSPFKSLLPFSI